MSDDPQWRDAVGASVADVGAWRLCVQRGTIRNDLPLSDSRSWGWGFDLSIERTDPRDTWYRWRDLLWVCPGYPYATRDEAKRAAVEALREAQGALR